jgi:predicted MPP superfamily phosphohydrolase
LNRRKFLGLSALGAVGLAAGDGLLEPHRLATTFHRVALGKSSTGTSISLVQITDLHLPGFEGHEERIARAVNEIRPDIIAITGDSIDRKWRLPVLAEFMDALDQEIPKIAILGNWEYWSGVDLDQLASVYERRNTKLLVNRSATLDLRGKRIRFVGIDDLVAGRPDVDISFEDRSPVDAEVILAHCPEHRDLVRSSSSLMLSGHTHGGQVNLFGFAPFCPKGSGSYVRGWYGVEKPQGAGRVITLQGPAPLYVSKGLGTTILPIRFDSTPELARFELIV